MAPTRTQLGERVGWERRRVPWKGLRRHWLAVVSGGLLLPAVLSALLTSALSPYDPNLVSTRETLRGRAERICSGRINSGGTSSAARRTAAARP